MSPRPAPAPVVELDPPDWLDQLAAQLAHVELLTYLPDGPYVPETRWPAFLERRPPEPAEVVVLTGTGGPESALDDEPTVQIVVRSPDSRRSRGRAEAIRNYLHELVGGVRLPGGLWLVNAPGPGVVSLGLDEQERHLHATNHRLTITREGAP